MHVSSTREILTHAIMRAYSYSDYTEDARNDPRACNVRMDCLGPCAQRTFLRIYIMCYLLAVYLYFFRYQFIALYIDGNYCTRFIPYI